MFVFFRSLFLIVIVSGEKTNPPYEYGNVSSFRFCFASARTGASSLARQGGNEALSGRNTGVRLPVSQG